MMHGAVVTREIDLADATAGMTLAAEVLDDHGSILLAKDAVLSDGVLASLRRRGVRNCVIWMPPCDEGPSGEETVAYALARLDGLFRNTQQDEPNKHLLDLLRAYRSGTLA
jgi:hypothetical protein